MTTLLPLTLIFVTIDTINNNINIQKEYALLNYALTGLLRFQHMKDIPLNERIILALDVESAEQAKELVKRTESHISFYKVGLQLFMASWFNIVDWLSTRGHKVMVDLKFFDIPETVKLAVAQLNNKTSAQHHCMICRLQQVNITFASPGRGILSRSRRWR